MTNREITFAIKAAVITFILLFFGIKILFYGMLSNGWYEKRLTCGTVLGKSEQIKGKYVHVDYYVFMQFDNGDKGYLDVTPITHFTASIGKRMCFNVCRADYMNEPTYLSWLQLFGFLSLIFGFIGLSGLMVCIYDFIKSPSHDKP